MSEQQATELEERASGTPGSEDGHQPTEMAEAPDTDATSAEGESGEASAREGTDDSGEDSTNPPGRRRTSRAELRARIYEAERRAAQYEQQLAELRQAQATQRNPEPDLDTYLDSGKSHRDWQRDWQAWSAKAAAPAQDEQSHIPPQAAPFVQMGMTPSQGMDFAESWRGAVTGIKDFTSVMQAAVGQGLISDKVIRLCAETGHDDPALLAYHLARTPAVAERIARASSDTQAAAALGRFAANLDVSSKAASGKRSSAPPPTPAVAGSGDLGSQDPTKMTAQEFAAYRRQQMRAKRGR